MRVRVRVRMRVRKRVGPRAWPQQSVESGPGTIYCGRVRAWLWSGPPGGGGTRGGGRWGAPVGVLDGEVEVEGLQQDALAHEDLLLERPEILRLRVGCGRRVVLRLEPVRESGRRSSVWGGLWTTGLWLRRGWGHWPRCGGAPWPMAVAGVAVWCCRWRGRPPCQQA